MWTFIAGIVLALVAVYVLAPKPQSRPPAGIEDIEAPTAEEGKEIPVLFGCRDIRGPNVVWYGDLRTTAIKKKGGKK
jgi:hypothetical protein